MEHEFEPHGAVRQLWRIRRWPRGSYQVLLEGPAGTGKTRGLLEWVHWMCAQHPGIRVLFLRRTKESLAESVLDTWENHVLWPGHPAIVGTAGVHNRQFYTFPNGSHVVLGGLADKRQATKTFSTQFDIVILFEAREIPSMEMWGWLARANRNYKIPWQMRIADTNPGPQFHWLNRYFPNAEEGGAFHRLPARYRDRPPYTIKCDAHHVTVCEKPEHLALDEEGKVVVLCPVCGERARGGSTFRLLSRFTDNPVWWDRSRRRWTPDGLEYVEGNLAQLDGAPRANLYEGRWATEEGVIYGQWDPTVHVVAPEDAPPAYEWYLGSFDQGIRHPGCLQVWGVIDNKMWLVHELYRTEQDLDWWAAKVLEADERFELQALVCDHDLDYVHKFNQFLGKRGGEWIARNANKNLKVGIQLMRWALSRREGGPHLYVVRGYGAGKDPQRVRAMKPASFEEEIGSYVWRLSEEGKPKKEEPDPTCADHSMDAARYACMYQWGRDLAPAKSAREYKDGTLGSILRHQAVWEAAETGEWAEAFDPSA